MIAVAWVAFAVVFAAGVWGLAYVFLQGMILELRTKMVVGETLHLQMKLCLLMRGIAEDEVQRTNLRLYQERQAALSERLDRYGRWLDVISLRRH